MGTMSDKERDSFLEKPRYGTLNTLRRDGTPIGIPVWFEWNGEAVRMFTLGESPKIKRLEVDARASLLVVNELDEHETWVAFDGPIKIRENGGFDLAEKLSTRYWDLSDPKRRGTLESWREVATMFRLLEMKPTKIRTYKD